jgi:hypothetical protein
MPHECIIQDKQVYIEAKVFGSAMPGREANDAIDVLAKITDICHKKGIYSILAIWDVPGPFPLIAAYDIVESSDKLNWDNFFKMAIVYLHKERLSDALFIETVAVNRGI